MKRVILLATVMSCFLLASCTALWHDFFGTNVRKGVSSSLVNYLYPEGEIPPDYDQTVPNLNIPLRVGLAFVPAPSSNIAGLTGANKNLLLEKVKQTFSDRDFISQIVVIPDTYLRSGRGFRTVEQVARLHGVDVMALVSYDQVAYVDDNKLSILYWTVVGAYAVKGSKNDIQTFVDTAIFDVKTNKLLFRAPGINHLEAKSTLINSAEYLRKARANGFSLAMSDMTDNLNKELEQFKERIKTDRSVTVTHREGYGGGGAFDLTMILLLITCLFAKRLHHDWQRET
ncbi:MAG: rhombotarget lipoprotein [Gammaproteobacteria bacterium]|nr:rhombotarget lipoprotein [Gammaproteobacteria bacterium]